MNKKNYKAPCAEITRFECADIITASQLGTKIEGKNPVTGGSYVYVGSSNWSDINKGN